MVIAIKGSTQVITGGSFAVLLCSAQLPNVSHSSCWLSSPPSLDPFSLSLTSGAVVVVRPDGIVGYAVALEEGGRIDEYFEGIFV